MDIPYIRYLVFFLVTLMSGCDDSPSSSNAPHDSAQLSETQKRYYFGFDLRSSPQEDARQYLPLLAYLKKQTGFNFDIRFTPASNNIGDDLRTGKIDFAAIGAVSFIKANSNKNNASEPPIITVARGINNLNQAEYRSFIIVHPDSKIKSLSQLRNKRFAFGNTNSTQGHLIPRIILDAANIRIEDFRSFKFTGSHQQCADAVISKRFDACGLQDTLAQTLADKNLVRILHRSNYFPSSGIAASGKLTTEVIEKVQQALLKFDPLGKHAKDLYHWDKTEMQHGFAPVRDSDYDVLRQALSALNL